MSNFIPNSFQTPNAYVDQFMHLLNGSEYKVLCYLVRRIFGFQKRQDRVSIHQITHGIRKRDGDFLDHGTGLSTAGAHAALQNLIEFGLVLKVANNNLANEGILYELQLDSTKVNYDGLVQRDDSNRKDANLRTVAARLKKNPALLSDRTPKSNDDPFCATENLSSVQQKGGLLSDRTDCFCSTEAQKPLEKTVENPIDNQRAEISTQTKTGADAPAPTHTHVDPEISLFHEVTGRFPTKDQIPLVIHRWKERELKVDELQPYWQEWVARDHKRTSLGWLDWVDEGCIPTPWGKRGKPSIIDQQTIYTDFNEDPSDLSPFDPKANDLWQKILDRVNQIPSIHKVDFETWINPAIPTKFENNCLIVSSANRFGCNWLEQNLTQPALELLKQLTGEELRIRFQVHSAG